MASTVGILIHHGEGQERQEALPVSQSSEEGSTSRDRHEQYSAGEISGDDDRDSDSTRTSDGEGSAPPRSGDEGQGSAAAAPQVRYTPPPRPRPRLYAAPTARPVSTVGHHRQLAGRLYEMEMDDMLNRRRETLSPLAEKYYTHILESASPSVSVTSPASSSVTSSADDTSRLYEMEMYDMLNRRRETLSPLAEKYYTHILESASPSVSVTSPASSSVTSSADDTSSEASSPSSHSSVVSCQTPVQGRSHVELDFVCQTSTESSTETTVSRPVTHVTSPLEAIQCTSTSNVPSNTVPLVGAPSYREAITSHCSISASDLRGCPRLTGAPDQNVVEILG